MNPFDTVVLVSSALLCSTLLSSASYCFSNHFLVALLSREREGCLGLVLDHHSLITCDLWEYILSSHPFSSLRYAHMHVISKTVQYVSDMKHLSSFLRKITRRYARSLCNAFNLSLCNVACLVSHHRSFHRLRIINSPPPPISPIPLSLSSSPTTHNSQPPSPPPQVPPTPHPPQTRPHHHSATPSSSAPPQRPPTTSWSDTYSVRFPTAQTHASNSTPVIYSPHARKRSPR